MFSAMTRSLYLETYGCQMNQADSELIRGLLAGHGYVAVEQEEQADVVLLNTCAIREKAEERIFGRLGWLKSSKAARPSMTIVVAGCMAAHLKDKLARRAPYVDLVVGPDAYRRLPELLEQVRHTPHDPFVDVRLDRRELYEGIAPQRRTGISGWISIMRGCDKFCAFCVVPYVRGRERSVSPDQIVAQAEQMQRQGFREVTLLGQTVSAYRFGECSFAELLRRIHANTDMRIRFMSPYPTDFDGALLQTLAELPRVGRHLHLPVQSGSSAVLEAMGRQYTAEQYLQLIERVRATLPEFALSTDVIVGYPGETEVDFERTLALSTNVRFDSAFMFAYSERPGTIASRKFPDDIPAEVKAERLQRLIALQAENSRQRNGAMVGRRVEVLVEGQNPRDDRQSMGRSSCFRPTVLDSDETFQAGELVAAQVHAATTHTIFAKPNKLQEAAA